MMPFVATAVLWVRSYWVADTVRVSVARLDSRDYRHTYWYLQSGRGGLAVVRRHRAGSAAAVRSHDYAPGPAEVRHTTRSPDEHPGDVWNVVRGVEPGGWRWRWGGFFGRRESRPTVWALPPDGPPLLVTLDEFILGVPHAVVVVLAAVLPGRPLWRAARRRRRAHAGECPACGYSLTGNQSGVCPECGTAVPSTRSADLVPATDRTGASQPRAGG